jgi:hypothetical protein
MARPVIADQIPCRDCGGAVAMIWCADESWRRFDPDPVTGPGWWWSRRRGGMVAPSVVAASTAGTYRVHVCPEEDLPVGQLELFPAAAVTQPTRQPVPVRRLRQVTA